MVQNATLSLPRSFTALKIFSVSVVGTPYLAAISELSRHLIAFALILGIILRTAIEGPNPAVETQRKSQFTSAFSYIYRPGAVQARSAC